jgi:hypothetical protein
MGIGQLNRKATTKSTTVTSQLPAPTDPIPSSSPLNQTAFRLALCEEVLFCNGKQVTLHNSGATYVPDAIPIQNVRETHSKVYRGKLGWCVCCSSTRQSTYLGRPTRKQASLWEFLIGSPRSKVGCVQFGSKGDRYVRFSLTAPCVVPSCCGNKLLM